MHGSQQEKEVYKGMDLDTFLRRLVSKRPLVFMNAQDLFVLRDGSKGSYGANLFDAIGTDHEDPQIRLRDYISYDEMALSALLAISSPTTFINNGSRDNCGIPSNAGSFQRRGVYLAQTGARFERPGRMEAKHMLLRKSDTTTTNGYGADDADFSPFARWAKLYGMPHLPTFEEAAAVIAAAATRTSAGAGDTRDFVQLGDSAILDCRAYIARMEIVAETFLLEANDRAANEGKRASCFVVGLGLGVWSVHSCQQTLVIKAYARVLQRMPLPNIAELRFSYFRTSEWPLQEHEAHAESRHIAVRFVRGNPADRLEDPSLLLVAQYAADSNSFAGNEYWLGGAHLSGSGDPAAAACSTIAEIANPELHV
ncbi:Hypothetical Protein FCC1311_098342 [Hondaea fermentalgiana]|uniref:Uncharacterized protein n=1 Tax=Hondaea fermentalgiana TaxID=2315210 RepID=A0A2R5GYR7_9STRA|nr:Hypothetical Protein FCC1311_098342 [Hondaea fermentalgiana]|eukprot:GBG33611.1 Hypothetical Protein FCC1311_098342 [Hondaea fermentalgiana]